MEIYANKLGKQYTVLIDDDMADIVGGYSVFIDKDGYAICSRNEGGRNVKIRMHRMVIGAHDGDIVDHINRDKLDNRRCNLRIVSQHVNMTNTNLQSNNTSGHRGITFRKDTGKWQVRINVHGKTKHIGYYTTIDDAIIARKGAEIIYR